MKILVPIKRVVDYEAKIKVLPDGSGIDTSNVKFIINPFDEIAVEEAIRLKEEGTAEEIVVVSVGTEDSVQQLRYAMAMGADRAILVKYENFIDSDLAARLLSKVYEKEKPDIVILGKQAIDSDANQTGQLLAAYLNISQACFVSKLDVDTENKTCTCVREVDGGLETLKINLPCIITTDLRLNEPRYAPLPGIMKAKKKPLDIIPAEELASAEELKPKVQILKMSPPPARQAGKIVESVEELVKALSEEAKVL
ncbi:MAG: electron transfer flavoprotein subunit beta/FixA family protein [Candidatus Dadabacteria bacterium]|nr:MAG: electron transfer flavoprotein subunit beta/FixA family protein [Candidatus Dadabacteria bacterium]